MGGKLPTYIQSDAMQCGATCLRMICGYYGVDYSSEFISEFCRATNTGVSLKGICDAARELGFEAVGCRVSMQEILHAPLPCILHWHQNHYVVLYKVSCNGKRFHIADPAKGKTVLTREEFEEGWISTRSAGVDKGVALFLTKTDKFGGVREYVARDRRSFRFLWGYVMQYRKYFMQIIAGLLLGCVLQLIMPFLTQWIVDIGIRHEDIGFIWLVLLGEFFIVVGKVSTDFIRRWLLLHISIRINLSLISDFFIKLLKLPMSFFDTKVMGDLLQRMSDHGRVQSFLTGQLLGIIFSCLSFVIFGIVLLIYNRLIFSVFIVGSVIYGLWMSLFLKKRKVIDYEMFERQADSNNKTYQFITSMQEIKLQDCENRRRWEWEDTQAELFGVKLKSLRLQQWQEAGSVFINEIKNILITVMAASAVITGDMTLGSMLAVQYIIGQLNSPVSELMAFIYTLQDVKISLERINEIHEGENEECDSLQLKELSGEKNIELRDVEFRYDIHSPINTIDGVSLEIPANKVTAIVGASGSGKTTLIKLMLGYYKVNKGSIMIAGENIERYNLKEWRRRCGVVMQDGVIFSESIARNIAVGDGDIDMDRLEMAARMAEIHDYVMGLPLKYDTRIGRDGSGISQGQRQRILIARAVYRNPDFIFLDEATNSLDAKNERMIVENLGRFYEGRTVVVVAHRLSTVRDADNIIVMDKGRVVETGTHEELTAKGGAYYTLVKNQLELGS
ncbi:MAG: peptidase domain-containing ABC transporter [Bacteroidales bacterium]|nr:peptidase domain-containing ABC transporter [Bacteroidales bacterium]